MSKELTPGAHRAAEAVVRAIAEYNELSGIHIMLPSFDKVAEIIERETGLPQAIATAEEAGARREREAMLPLLKRIERAAQGLGGYIGRDGQLLKEVQKVIRESEGTIDQDGVDGMVRYFENNPNGITPIGFKKELAVVISD
jgi:hypothetical protein